MVQDVPQVVFLMSGGQLIVCNVGSFMPEQPHAAVVRPPAPPPPLSFAVAVPEAATAARPVTAAPAAALAPDPAPPPSPPGSDLQVFQDSAEGVPSQRLTPVRSDVRLIVLCCCSRSCGAPCLRVFVLLAHVRSTVMQRQMPRLQLQGSASLLPMLCTGSHGV